MLPLLTLDTRRRSHAETVQHLSAIYRVWQGLVLDLSVIGSKAILENVTLLLKLPQGSALLTALAEYVVRAELESTISEVVHGRPTGMGPYQLASIQRQYGAITANAVASELLARLGGIMNDQNKDSDVVAVTDSKVSLSSHPNTMAQVPTTLGGSEIPPPPVSPDVIEGDSKDPNRPVVAAPTATTEGGVSGDSHASVADSTVHAQSSAGDSHGRDKYTTETVP